MFSIAPYAIQLLDESREPVDLWKFSGKNNLKEVLNTYYQNEMRTYTPISQTRLFRVAKLLEASEISVAGQYETGEHGLQSDLYDVDSKKISHKKKKTEADMLPFPFLFILPKSDQLVRRQKGMLLLARHKSYGIRTITIPHLKAHIEAQFPKFQFNVNRVYPAALARTLLTHGTLKAIRLMKYRMPHTLEDLLDEEDTAQLQNVEIVLRAKRNASFKAKEKFLQLLGGKGDYRGLYESQDFACNNVKLDIELGGRTRRINIGRQQVSSDVEITEDVEIDSNGFPTLASWFEQADNLGISLHHAVDLDISLSTSIDDYL